MLCITAAVKEKIAAGGEEWKKFLAEHTDAPLTADEEDIRKMLGMMYLKKIGK